MAKKMKDFKKIEKKVIELKNWSKSPTYKSRFSDEVEHYTYSADYYVNGKKKMSFNVKANNKEYALKRFLAEMKKPNPKEWLWG